MTEEIIGVGKFSPSKATQFIDKTQLGESQFSSGVKDISSTEFASYLAEAEKVQNQTAIELSEQHLTATALREQAIQEAKETFAQMMEIRQVLIDKYNHLMEMQSTTPLS